MYVGARWNFNCNPGRGDLHNIFMVEYAVKFLTKKLSGIQMCPNVTYRIHHSYNPFSVEFKSNI